MHALRLVVSLIAPPRCASCQARCGSTTAVCEGCAHAVELLAAPPAPPPPPGLDAAWAAAAHDGVCRELVAALKFRGLLPVAELLAERIAWAVPAGLLDGVLVPAPPAPARLRRRGFDPADEIAVALANVTGLELRRCLQRRDGPRQVGRPRRERLSDAPIVTATGSVPPRTVLVDDVWTTGATLSACARALRARGSDQVRAVTFARKL